MSAVEGEGSLGSQCPTCSQHITPSPNVRHAPAECPSCGATAEAAASPQASTPPSVFGTARRAVSDDERTHLILDAVPLDEDASGESDGDGASAERPAPPARRAPDYDPERTHLILDPLEAADDDDEDDAGHEQSPAAASTLPAPPSEPSADELDSAPRDEAPAAAADDQPTRLFIDPVHLRSADDAGARRELAGGGGPGHGVARHARRRLP